jgi:hypothetical protein
MKLLDWMFAGFIIVEIRIIVALYIIFRGGRK